MSAEQIGNLKVGDRILVRSENPWIGEIVKIGGYSHPNHIALKDFPNSIVSMWYDIRDPRLEVVGEGDLHGTR